MRRFAAALVALTLGAAAGAADASVTTITYTGKLGALLPGQPFGFDGRFTPGADFSARFQLDDGLGASSFGPAGSQYAYTFPSDAGLMGVAVTIGGVAFDFRCDAVAGTTPFCWVGHTQGPGQMYSSLEGHALRLRGPSPFMTDNFLALMVANAGIPADFRTPFTYASLTPIGGGQVRISERAPQDLYGWAQVSIYSVTATNDAPPPGIPEPTSWALMILGFAFSGALLRRRRVSAAAISGSRRPPAT